MVPKESGFNKSVKRFERSNGLDTALYKNYLYIKTTFYIVTFFRIVCHDKRW